MIRTMLELGRHVTDKRAVYQCFMLSKQIFLFILMIVKTDNIYPCALPHIIIVYTVKSCINKKNI